MQLRPSHKFKIITATPLFKHEEIPGYATENCRMGSSCRHFVFSAKFLSRIDCARPKIRFLPQYHQNSSEIDKSSHQSSVQQTNNAKMDSDGDSHSTPSDASQNSSGLLTFPYRRESLTSLPDLRSQEVFTPMSHNSEHTQSNNSPTFPVVITSTPVQVQIPGQISPNFLGCYRSRQGIEYPMVQVNGCKYY